MSKVILSHHAAKRMRQRAIRDRDLDIVFANGAQLDESTFFMSNSSVDQAVRRHKDEIKALERLRGQKLVMGSDNVVVTIYKSSHCDQKRAYRREKWNSLQR